MMKMLCASTDEMDDLELAVEELNEQLNLAENQLKNAVGIAICHPEFVETGALAAICESFPFDVVGGTALLSAIDDDPGAMILTLSVLTSDDVEFVTSLTGPLEADPEGVLTTAYNETEKKLDGPPAMGITFLPMIPTLGGERLFSILAEAAGETPIFGTLTSDHTTHLTKTYTVLNGTVERDVGVLLLMKGPVDPEFFVINLPEEKTQKQKAVVTAAEGNLLKEVNGMSLREHMKTLGLTKENGIEGTTAIPFVFDLHDGTPPVARAIYSVTPEGYGVSGINAPVDSTLAISALDPEDVFSTAEEMVEKIKATGKTGGALIIPCLSRNLVLGIDVASELKAIMKAVGDVLPAQVLYSAGEICPVCGSEGQTVNRFHNFSIIACVF